MMTDRVLSGKKGGREKVRLRAFGGQGDDVVKQKGGRGKDNFVYSVSEGQNKATTNGSKGRDFALILTNALPVLVKNRKGEVIYKQSGTKTIITLKKRQSLYSTRMILNSLGPVVGSWASFHQKGRGTKIAGGRNRRQ